MAEYDEEGAGQKAKSEEERDGKKKVLLLGDSIRIGYCGYTADFLSDIADVRYPDENCRNTQYTYISLAWWKNLFDDPMTVDAVYFNNGHWDIAHWGGDERSLCSVEQYTDMIVRIYNRLGTLFPNAKIIYATTMPANPNGSQGLNPRSNDEILSYNRSAVAALKPLGAVIDDVFEIYRSKTPDFYSDYCHMTPDGFKELGEHVAKVIRKIIM